MSVPVTKMYDTVRLARPGKVDIVVNMHDLVTAAQIAERAGLSRNAVGNWQSRYSDFPAPLIKTDKVKLWSWTAVSAWIKEGNAS